RRHVVFQWRLLALTIEETVKSETFFLLIFTFKLSHQFILDRKDSAIMSGRGGLPVKNMLYAVVALFLVYLLYVYHGSQNRLHEAEITGARYKREVEERVSEIQDLVKGHDKFQETCQKEKKELQNTVTSVNTKYQMLESHQRDTESDLNTMKQHMETMKREHQDAYTQHAQEYQALKQDKDNEIARIKDELADAKRRNLELENSISGLQQRLQEGEVLRRRLAQCDTAQKNAEGSLASCEKALSAAQSQNQQNDARSKNVEADAGKGDVAKDDGGKVAIAKGDKDPKDGGDDLMKNIAQKGGSFKDGIAKDDPQGSAVHKDDPLKDQAGAAETNRTAEGGAGMDDQADYAVEPKSEAEAYQSRLRIAEQDL
ncbi:hypothetical protein EGW08_000644, partial [Elysia chlorotica]